MLLECDSLQVIYSVLLECDRYLSYSVLLECDCLQVIYSVLLEFRLLVHVLHS